MLWDRTQSLLLKVSGTSEPLYIYSLSVLVSSEVCVSGWMLACCPRCPLKALWLWLTVDQWSLIDSPNDRLSDWFTFCRFLESYFMKVITVWTLTLNSFWLDCLNPCVNTEIQSIDPHYWSNGSLHGSLWTVRQCSEDQTEMICRIKVIRCISLKIWPHL